MALTKASLEVKIKAAMTAEGFAITNTYSYANKLASAIADAIVDEITTNAVVTTEVTGTLPDGPQAAAGLGTIS